jgi:hypothetical protein
MHWLVSVVKCSGISNYANTKGKTVAVPTETAKHTAPTTV